MFCYLQDPRFNNEIDLQMGYRTHSILSTPIKDCDGVVIGVAQAINRTNCKDEPFNLHDEKVNACLFNLFLIWLFHKFSFAMNLINSAQMVKESHICENCKPYPLLSEMLDGLAIPACHKSDWCGLYIIKFIILTERQSFIRSSTRCLYMPLIASTIPIKILFLNVGIGWKKIENVCEVKVTGDRYSWRSAWWKIRNVT